MKALTTLAAAAVGVALLGTAPATETAMLTISDPFPAGAAQFDHAKHAGLGTCTTCHAAVAQDRVYPEPSFCAQCHNGNLQPTVTWTPPAQGSAANLRFRHADHVGNDECATCHVENGDVRRAVVDRCMACHGLTEHPRGDAAACTQCHVQPPAPRTHEFGWRTGHASQAASSPETCATCHVRTDCLDCHRPGAASPAGAYHPADFLSSHSVAAYSREMSCATCHNVGAFCQDCHKAAGFVQGGPASGVYHDGTGAFTAGHGQAARQSLESCVACHSERDCIRCHVNLNPHGIDFNAEKQQKAARSVCAVCHTPSTVGDSE